MYSASQTQQLEKTSRQFLTRKPSEKDITELKIILRFHEYRYYILSDPLISDTEYDQLFKQLEATWKNTS